jgi:hypothetical protein
MFLFKTAKKVSSHAPEIEVSSAYPEMGVAIDCGFRFKPDLNEFG